MKGNTLRTSATTLLLLHIMLGINSLADVFSKEASGFDFLSLPFCGFYLLMLLMLFIYAIGWQQVIKRMPLSSAFANRAITIVWGIFWGIILFGESLTIGKVIGAALIIVGIIMFSREDADLVQDAPLIAGEEEFKLNKPYEGSKDE